MSKNLPSPTGPHSRSETNASVTRFERRIKRSFAKLVGAAPEAVDTLVELIGPENDNKMVRYLSARFILSAVGLGEISKQVQKTTTEITMQNKPARTVEEQLSRIPDSDIDQLLAALQQKLEGKVVVVEGEVIDDAPAPAPALLSPEGAGTPGAGDPDAERGGDDPLGLSHGELPPGAPLDHEAAPGESPPGR